MSVIPKIIIMIIIIITTTTTTTATTISMLIPLSAVIAICKQK